LRTDDWCRSSQGLRGRGFHSARKGPAHGMIGLILNRYFTKMGFRVRESDEMIVRRPCFKPSVFDIYTLPAILLHLSSSAISAIKNLRDLILLLFGRFLQELPPTMLAE
jgi:hypothetical protein